MEVLLASRVPEVLQEVYIEPLAVPRLPFAVAAVQVVKLFFHEVVRQVGLHCTGGVRLSVVWIRAVGLQLQECPALKNGYQDIH